MTPAEENMAQLLDSIAGRKPMRRGTSAIQQEAAPPVRHVDDSTEALRALMDHIYLSYTPSADPTRLAIADAIARHLGAEYPASHGVQHQSIKAA